MQVKEEQSAQGQLWRSCCAPINPDFWGSEDHLKTSLLHPGVKRRAELLCVIAGSQLKIHRNPAARLSLAVTSTLNCVFGRHLWLQDGGMFTTGSLTPSPLEYKVTVAWEIDDQATVYGKGGFCASPHLGPNNKSQTCETCKDEI